MHTINFAPFAEAGRQELEDPLLRTRLFGSKTDAEIGEDFVQWIELRHANDGWDPEVMYDVGRLLESVRCYSMDERLAQWYRATNNEHRLALWSAFLHGYWRDDNLGNAQLIDQVICETTQIDRTSLPEDYGAALWMLHCLGTRDQLLLEHPEQRDVIRQFVAEQKSMLRTRNELTSDLAALLGD